MSEVKKAVDDHVRALIALVRSGLEPDEYAVRDDGLREAREALSELEARLFPGDQGESDADDALDDIDGECPTCWGPVGACAHGSVWDAPKRLSEQELGALIADARGDLRTPHGGAALDQLVRWIRHEPDRIEYASMTASMGDDL